MIKKRLKCPALTKLEVEAIQALEFGKLTVDQHLTLVALYPDCNYAYWETRVHSDAHFLDLQLASKGDSLWGASPRKLTKEQLLRAEEMRPYVEQEMNILRKSGRSGGPSREALFRRLFGFHATESREQLK
jgi:hypothetical protein